MTKPDKERLRNLERAKAELAKQYGREDIIKKASDITVERVSTGLISVDELMGGGLPKGRWSMIYGGKSCGKTSLSCKIIGEIQKAGGIATYIDAEHAYDPVYAASLGVDNKTLNFVEPYTLEEGITAVVKLATMSDIVVLDSIVAVAPEAEIERAIEQETMALIPKKLSQFFRICTAPVSKSKAIVLLIDQTRTNLGSYIAVDSFPGGNALAHYCSLIMHMRRGSPKDDPTEKVDGKDVSIGSRIYIKAEKTKISATEGKKSFFDLLKKPPHFDTYSDVLNVAETKGLITHAGAWYYYGETKIAQGSNGVLETLRKDDSLFAQLRSDIMTAKSGVIQGESNDGSTKTED